MLPNPGEARLRQITIHGSDLTPYIRELSISESIFLSLITIILQSNLNFRAMKKLELCLMLVSEKYMKQR
jgi:hypothetical protein